MKNAEQIMALQCIEMDAAVKSVAEAKEIEWENIATRVGGKVSHNPHKVEETDAISVPATWTKRHENAEYRNTVASKYGQDIRTGTLVRTVPNSRFP